MVLRRNGRLKRATFALDCGSAVNPFEIPIRRYVKVKSDANPFDQHWPDYFESRKSLR